MALVWWYELYCRNRSVCAATKPEVAILTIATNTALRTPFSLKRVCGQPEYLALFRAVFYNYAKGIWR